MWESKQIFGNTNPKIDLAYSIAEEVFLSER